MFYLFVIAYSFRYKDVPGEFYEITQVIGREFDETKQTAVNIFSNRNVFEIKLLKVTPITSPFIVHTTAIPDRIYHKLECIEKKKALGVGFSS
jgi:hypothetical protein